MKSTLSKFLLVGSIGLSAMSGTTLLFSAAPTTLAGPLVTILSGEDQAKLEKTRNKLQKIAHPVLASGRKKDAVLPSKPQGEEDVDVGTLLKQLKSLEGFIKQQENKNKILENNIIRLQRELVGKGKEVDLGALDRQVGRGANLGRQKEEVLPQVGSMPEHDMEHNSTDLENAGNVSRGRVSRELERARKVIENEKANIPSARMGKNVVVRNSSAVAIQSENNLVDGTRKEDFRDQQSVMGKNARGEGKNFKSGQAKISLRAIHSKNPIMRLYLLKLLGTIPMGTK